MSTYVARGGSAYTVYRGGRVIGVLVRKGGVWHGRTPDSKPVTGPTRDACAQAMWEVNPANPEYPGYTE